MITAFTRSAAGRLAALLLVLAILPLTACKKDDIVLKNLDVRLGGDIILNPQPPTLDSTWTLTIDPEANVDVRENRHKLREVSVSRITYTVADFTGDSATTGTGTWTFYPTDNPADVHSISPSPNPALHFLTLKTSGAERDLPLNEADKAKIVELVKSGKKLTVVFQGGVSHPAYVVFNIRVYTQLKVGV